MKKLLFAFLLTSFYSLAVVANSLEDAEKSVVSAFDKNEEVQKEIQDFIAFLENHGITVRLDKKSYTKLLQSVHKKDGSVEYIFIVYRQVETSVAYGTTFTAVGSYSSKTNKSIIRYVDLSAIGDNLLNGKKVEIFIED